MKKHIIILLMLCASIFFPSCKDVAVLAPVPAPFFSNGATPEIIFNSNGTNRQSLSFYAPDSWTIQIDAVETMNNWFVIDKMEGPEGYAELEITCIDPDVSGNIKGVFYIVIADSRTPVTVKYQNYYNIDIPSRLDFAPEGEMQTFTSEGLVQFEYECDASWLLVSRSDDRKRFKFSALPNLTGDLRKATILFNNPDGKNGLVLYVYQHGDQVTFAQPELQEEVLSLYDSDKDNVLSYDEACHVQQLVLSDLNLSVPALDLESLTSRFPSVEECVLENISGFEQLKIHDARLSDMVIKSCKDLIALEVANSHMWDNLIVRSNPKLEDMTLGSSEIYNLRVYENPALDKISANDISIINAFEVTSNGLKVLEVHDMKGYEDDYYGYEETLHLNLSGNRLNYCTITDSPAITSINLSFNEILSCVFPETLEVLDLKNNNLTCFDASTLRNLNSLNLRGNRIGSIDLTDNVSLKDVNLSCNPLKEFKLHSPAILNLNLAGTGLQTIDLSPYTSLRSFSGAENPFRSFTLPANSSLSFLDLCKCAELEEVSLLPTKLVNFRLNLLECFSLKTICRPIGYEWENVSCRIQPGIVVDMIEVQQ